MPIPFDESPSDANFTFVGLVQYIQMEGFESLFSLWRCDRCAALVEDTGRMGHLKWHLGVQ